MPLRLLVERDRRDKRGWCVRAVVDADVRRGLLLPGRYRDKRRRLRGLRVRHLYLDELDERLELCELLVGSNVLRRAAPAPLHGNQRRRLCDVRGWHIQHRGHAVRLLLGLYGVLVYRWAVHGALHPNDGQELHSVSLGHLVEPDRRDERSRSMHAVVDANVRTGLFLAAWHGDERRHLRSLRSRHLLV